MKAGRQRQREAPVVVAGVALTETRLRVLGALSDSGPISARALSQSLCYASGSTVWQHLRALVRAGLVESTPVGYCVAPGVVVRRERGAVCVGRFIAAPAAGGSFPRRAALAKGAA